MLLLLAKLKGIGVETADMLVHEVFYRALLWRASSSTRRRAPSDHASVRPLACLILGINLRQPVDRPKTAHPTNLKELVIQPSTELKSTAPLLVEADPAIDLLDAENPDRRRWLCDEPAGARW
jgi:hypothetical protein